MIGGRLSTAALLVMLALPAFGEAQKVSEGRAFLASKQARLTFPDGKSINADVVDTPADRERGLMFRRKLPRDYGMLFAFPQQMGMQFWMKNTLVPLDIIFIGADKKITKIHARVKASTETTPEIKVARAGGLGQFVLELPAGAAERHRLAEGQELSFDVPIPVR